MVSICLRLPSLPACVKPHAGVSPPRRDIVLRCRIYTHGLHLRMRRVAATAAALCVAMLLLLQPLLAVVSDFFVLLHSI